MKARTALAIAAAAIATFTAIKATGDRPSGNRPPADHHDPRRDDHPATPKQR